MNELDKKIKSTFPEESVYKVQERYSVLTGRNLPSFIKDWLMKRFTEEESDISRKSAYDQHFP